MRNPVGHDGKKYLPVVRNGELYYFLVAYTKVPLKSSHLKVSLWLQMVKHTWAMKMKARTGG